MSEPKTQPHDASVDEFLNKVEDPRKREDAFAIKQLMEDITGEQAIMWGTSIVGCGKYHYRYASGREGVSMLVGFSPRKQNLTLYIMAGFDNYENLLSRLGKYKTGKACLYIKRLSDVDVDTLRELVRQSVDHMIATNSPAD